MTFSEHPIRVDADTFVRAETDRMFHALQASAGGVNRLSHEREPADVHRQTVIRLNRDTLYSSAVVDVSAGASITIPEHGDRYLSVMVVDQDHYIQQIIHDPGVHALDASRFPTAHAFIAVRTLVDPADPADIAAVARIQDAISLEAASAVEFVSPDYDTASLDATRSALLALAAGLGGFERSFGSREEVDPVRHLIGTAAGWGGLPEHEAIYLSTTPDLPAGSYELVVRDVPVDGFWSISVYNAEGYFEPNEPGSYTVNNLTAVRDADGAVTVRFGEHPAGSANVIPIVDGWNYTVRLYRPRREIRDGEWRFPTLDARS